jgi:hypothetical protein
VRTFDLAEFPDAVDLEHRRAKEAWWRALEPVARLLAQPGPRPTG